MYLVNITSSSAFSLISDGLLLEPFCKVVVLPLADMQLGVPHNETVVSATETTIRKVVPDIFACAMCMCHRDRGHQLVTLKQRLWPCSLHQRCSVDISGCILPKYLLFDLVKRVFSLHTSKPLQNSNAFSSCLSC